MAGRDEGNKQARWLPICTCRSLSLSALGIAVYKVGSYVVVVMLGNMRMRRQSTLVF